MQPHIYAKQSKTAFSKCVILLCIKGSEDQLLSRQFQFQINIDAARWHWKSDSLFSVREFTWFSWFNVSCGECAHAVSSSLHPHIWTHKRANSIKTWRKSVKILDTETTNPDSILFRWAQTILCVSAEFIHQHNIVRVDYRIVCIYMHHEAPTKFPFSLPEIRTLHSSQTS